MSRKININALESELIVDEFILSLDGSAAARTQFVSCWQARAKRVLNGKQILVSPLNYKLFREDAAEKYYLPSPYYRSITLGNITVKLLPNGYAPGTSGLLISKENSHVLYLPQYSQTAFEGFASLEVERVDTLLLRITSENFGAGFSSYLQFRKFFVKARQSATGKRVSVFSESVISFSFLFRFVYENKIPFRASRAITRYLQALCEEPEEQSHWLRQVASLQKGHGPKLFLTTVKPKRGGGDCIHLAKLLPPGYVLQNIAELIQRVQPKKVVYINDNNLLDLEKQLPNPTEVPPVRSLITNVQESLF